MSKITDFLKLRERNTSYRKELIASTATFITIAYVLVVQPGVIVSYRGVAFTIDINDVMITKEAVAVVCAIISGLITLLMTLYVNLPSALVTGMGSSFTFGALVQSQQLSFGDVMAMALISGVIFLLLTVFDIHDLIVRVVPKNIKISIGTAIGFFIAYLGFKNTGIATPTENGIDMGNFADPAVMLAVLGLVIAAILTVYRMSGTILISIVIATSLGVSARITTVPSIFAKVPDFTEPGNVMFNLDFKPVFSFSSVILIFTTFYGGFLPMLGTILGVSTKAGMLDENGDLPNIQQPFLIDAIGTYAGALTGDTAVTTFVEFSVGVEAGGHTGFTSIVISVVFMVMVFLSPLVLMIPNTATGPVLIFVGLLMISGFKNTDFVDLTESFGPFIMIMLTVFTGSTASGISAGILASILTGTATGKFREVHPIMYVMAISLICCFIYG